MDILDFRLDVREKARQFEKFIREGDATDILSFEEWFVMFTEFVND